MDNQLIPQEEFKTYTSLDGSIGLLTYPIALLSGFISKIYK